MFYPLNYRALCNNYRYNFLFLFTINLNFTTFALFGRTYVYGALYPFGHGLSYTTFTYSDLHISPSHQGVQGDIHVSCKIKNTGKIKGDEVVQLYLRDEISSVTTYTKVLRGFERISLEAGEEQTVHFRLRPQDLGLWDKNMNFRVEPGSFKVMLGASSTDIRLHGQFEITP